MLPLDGVRHDDSSNSFATETELGSVIKGKGSKADHSALHSMVVPEMIEEQEDDVENSKIDIKGSNE